MQQKKPTHLAILGGTFCPIHNGHLNIAHALQTRFKFNRLIFIPNKAPVLNKIADVSTEHRLAMLKLALTPYPEFTIDCREINRSSPSFTTETLQSIRDELTDKTTIISLIIGEDNFQQLHRWHNWKTLFTLCNFIVIERPGFQTIKLTTPLKQQLFLGNIQELHHDQDLQTHSCGSFLRCHVGVYPISSTLIRTYIIEGKDIRPFLPQKIIHYIKQHHLFSGKNHHE